MLVLILVLLLVLLFLLLLLLKYLSIKGWMWDALESVCNESSNSEIGLCP